MELVKSYLLVMVFTAVAQGALLGGDKKDEETKYLKQKEQLKQEAIKLYEEQKELVETIKKKEESMKSEGKRVLEEYSKSSENVQKLLTTQATAPFINIVQVFINSSGEIRQEIKAIIQEAKIHRGRSEKEFEDTEKMYEYIKRVHRSDNTNKTIVEEVEGKIKRMGVTRDVIKEIKANLEKEEKKIKKNMENVQNMTRKMISYRYLLEIVTRTRNIIISTKNIYINSFNIKDGILHGDNKIESILKKGKLLSGEAQKRGLYKTDLSKIGKMVEQIGQIKDKHSKMAKEVVKTWESIKNLIKKQEQYETLIKKIGEYNKHTPNTGYTKSKSYYQIIVKLKIMTDKNELKMKEFKSESGVMMRRANEFLKEIDAIIKRKTVVNKKVPKLLQPERYEKEESESESESEDESARRGPKIAIRSHLESSDEEGLHLEHYKKIRALETADRKGERADKRKATRDEDEEHQYEPDMSRRRVKRTRTELDRIRESSRSSDESESESRARRSGPIDSESESDWEPRPSTSKVTPPESHKTKPKTVTVKIPTRSKSKYQLTDLESDSDWEPVGVSARSKSGSLKRQERVRSEGESESEWELDSRVKGASKEFQEKRSKMEGLMGFVKKVAFGKSSEDKKDKKEEPSVVRRTEVRKEELEPNRVKAEVASKLGGMEINGETRANVFKLIDLAYQLKNQFELVTYELKGSAKAGVSQIIRRILAESLHLYLTGVCETVLSMTRSAVEGTRK